MRSGFGGRGGYGCGGGEHVGPLGAEVGEGGDVLLPGFAAGNVVGLVHVVVVVLVGQAGEAVAELVHHHGAEGAVAGGGERVAVVDASSAVVRRVGQYDDVLVGYAGKGVVQGAQPQGGEVARGVEGVEVRGEGCVLPEPLAGNAHAALGRGQGYGHYLEAVGVALVGGGGEEGLAGGDGVGIEGVGLGLGVALGHNGHVDGLGVAGGMHHAVRRRGAGQVAQEYVGGAYGVGEGGQGFACEGVEREGYHGGVAWHGQEHDVLKGLGQAGGLLGAQPFLKEGGEGVAVDESPCALVVHGYAAVALQCECVEVRAAAGPVGQHAELVDGYVLGVHIAREGVVDAQRAVGKEGVEACRLPVSCEGQTGAGQQHQQVVGAEQVADGEVRVCHGVGCECGVERGAQGVEGHGWGSVGQACSRRATPRLMLCRPKREGCSWLGGR